MKTLYFKTSCLALLLLLTACGKAPESQEESLPIKQQAPTEAPDPSVVNQKLSQSIAQNNVQDMDTIIRANSVDLANTTLEGETPLIAAIRNDSTAIRDYLIQRPVDLEEAGKGGTTPLMTAAEYGRLTTVQLLIDKKVKLNKKNDAGNTALHLALKAKHEDIALALIKAGANIDITDEENRNAFRLAEDHDLKRVLELTRNLIQVEYGAPGIVSFKQVILAGNDATLRLMLQKFPTLAVDYESINPVALAIDVVDGNTGLKVANLLLDHKADVNGPKDATIAPLIKAVTLEKLSFLDLFLSRQANVQISDEKGLTALAHAVTLNNDRMVDRLLARGAKVKYSAMVEGKKKTIDTCDIARAVGKKAKNLKDKETIKIIKDRLDCGFWDWLF